MARPAARHKYGPSGRPSRTLWPGSPPGRNVAGHWSGWTERLGPVSVDAFGSGGSGRHIRHEHYRPAGRPARAACARTGGHVRQERPVPVRVDTFGKSGWAHPGVRAVTFGSGGSRRHVRHEPYGLPGRPTQMLRPLWSCRICRPEPPEPNVSGPSRSCRTCAPTRTGPNRSRRMCRPRPPGRPGKSGSGPSGRTRSALAVCRPGPTVLGAGRPVEAFVAGRLGAGQPGGVFVEGRRAPLGRVPWIGARQAGRHKSTSSMPRRRPRRPWARQQFCSHMPRHRPRRHWAVDGGARHQFCSHTPRRLGRRRRGPAAILFGGHVGRPPSSRPAQTHGFTRSGGPPGPPQLLPEPRPGVFGRPIRRELGPVRADTCGKRDLARPGGHVRLGGLGRHIRQERGHVRLGRSGPAHSARATRARPAMMFLTGGLPGHNVHAGSLGSCRAAYVSAGRPAGP